MSETLTALKRRMQDRFPDFAADIAFGERTLSVAPEHSVR